MVKEDKKVKKNEKAEKDKKPKKVKKVKVSQKTEAGKKVKVGGKVATEKVKVIEETAKELLAKLEIEADLDIGQGEEAIQVNLKTEKPAFLIGYHGETLKSFQLVLSLMVFRRLGEWLRILVDVDEYRQRRKESLERMALAALQKVKFSQEEYRLPPMAPEERRIIHLILAEHPEVKTESEGETWQRRVVIKPSGA